MPVDPAVETTRSSAPDESWNPILTVVQPPSRDDVAAPGIASGGGLSFDLMVIAILNFLLAGTMLVRILGLFGLLAGAVAFSAFGDAFEDTVQSVLGYLAMIAQLVMVMVATIMLLFNARIIAGTMMCALGVTIAMTVVVTSWDSGRLPVHWILLFGGCPFLGGLYTLIRARIGFWIFR